MSTETRIKRRNSYVVHEENPILIIEWLRTDREYDVSNSYAYAKLLSSHTETIKRCILHKMSVDEVKLWRSVPNRKGLIMVRSGQLYAIEITSKDVKILKNLLRHTVHLCGTKRLCCAAPADNPKDLCPYILSLKSSHIERYVEFIKDGYEIFDGKNQHSTLYVSNCSRIYQKAK